MSARVVQFQTSRSAEPLRDDAAFEQDEAFDDLVAGERISGPARGARRSSMLSASIIIVAGLGAGWVISKNPEAWESAASSARAVMSSAMQHSAPATAPAAAPATSSAPTIAAEASAEVKLPLPEIVVAQAPGAVGGTPVETAAIASAPVETPSAAEIAVATPTKLPPVTFDANDPLQKRAAAIGLDPDLSRSLLARLSADDFRNARHAIRTALAGKANAAAVIWPVKPEAKLAQFEVRFVDGAPPDCRRYVVIVSKDRWSTTARPMEKCGSAKAAG